MMAKLEISFPYTSLSTKAAACYCVAWGVFGAWLVPNLVVILNYVSSPFDTFFKVIIQLLFIVTSAALYAYVPFKMVSTSMQVARLRLTKKVWVCLARSSEMQNFAHGQN